MLTTCPECGLQISDKAITCPHYGYPLEPEVVKRAYMKPTKRAHCKLPNGFGSITEIKGRYLRSPFLARVCVGKTETGRPILRNLKPKAYFKTYNDAYAALVEYNKSPYDLSLDITMEELYEKWLPSYAENVAKTTVAAVRSCWKKCAKIYKAKVRELKAGDVREMIDDEPSAGMKKRIKAMLDNMLDYAMQYEIVDHNVSKTFKLSKSVMAEAETIRKGHVALTPEEVNRLWELKDEPFVDIMLIGCYTGMRPRELLAIKSADVHFEQGYFIGGSKTAAGKNRTIPIHEKIKPLFKKRLNISEYLFNKNGYQIAYWKLQRKTADVLPNHRLHDFRKTFVTYAKKSGMDDVAIKRIVGHQLDVTEGVYTERSLD